MCVCVCLLCVGRNVLVACVLVCCGFVRSVSFLFLLCVWLFGGSMCVCACVFQLVFGVFKQVNVYVCLVWVGVSLLLLRVVLFVVAVWCVRPMILVCVLLCVCFFGLLVVCVCACVACYCVWFVFNCCLVC